jgi:hypothetical protein
MWFANFVSNKLIVTPTNLSNLLRNILYMIAITIKNEKMN